MGTEVVETRRRIIRRPRLTKLLDESPARIKLLIAPAGYGKTTLAQEWLSDPSRKDVWYRGGPAAADVAALAAGLAVAASEVLPDAGRRMRDRLRATGHPEEDVEILAELFVEDLQPWPQNAWLAIDDYQFVMESVASEHFVDLVTQHTPLQLLITSRRRPTWGTARRIVYGEIQEIDRRDLAMEETEADRVLGACDSRGDDLVERAQGWPAVLGIAALVPHHSVNLDDLPDELYEYFAEELYRGANAPLREALHRLALVPAMAIDFFHRLFGSQALALLDDCSRIGAAQVSQDEIALHPLLRTFLNKKQARENPHELRSAADQLASQLISLGEWDAAFQIVSTHASPELVITLVGAAQGDLLAEARTQTLLAWLDFSARHHFSSSVLDFAEAEILFRQGRHARAEALAAQAAARSKEASLPKILIRAGQAAVMDSRDDKGLEYFRAAWTSATQDHERLEALVGMCFSALELGLDEEATGAMRNLSTLDSRSVDVTTRKAVVELVYSARMGGVGSALDIGARTMPLLEDARDPLIVTSFLNCYSHLLGLGALYAQALDVAELEAEKARRYRLTFALPHASLHRAASYSGLRDFAKASAEIDEAEALAGPGDIHVAMHAAALRARLALSKRRYEEAHMHSSHVWERPASATMNAEYLAYEALSHACLGDCGAARATAAKARGMHAKSVEAASLAACAEAISSIAANLPDASRKVLDAYSVIHSTGCLDALVTVARAYPAFLEMLLNDTGAAETSRRVFAQSNDFRLAAEFGLEVESTLLGPRGLLTPREAEVAGMIAQGLTNQEIAERLFISVSTVKVHVRHIMTKLDARTRSEVAGRIMADWAAR